MAEKPGLCNLLITRILDQGSGSYASKHEGAPELVTAGLTAAMDRESGRSKTTAPPDGPNIQ
jgi:hypothetical protein